MKDFFRLEQGLDPALDGGDATDVAGGGGAAEVRARLDLRGRELDHFLHRIDDDADEGGAAGG